jgi:hypothetical protein
MRTDPVDTTTLTTATAAGRCCHATWTAARAPLQAERLEQSAATASARRDEEQPDVELRSHQVLPERHRREHRAHDAVHQRRRSGGRQGVEGREGQRPAELADGRPAGRPHRPGARS